MTDPTEALRRLARRGPHRAPDEVIAAALAAARDLPTSNLTSIPRPHGTDATMDAQDLPEPSTTLDRRAPRWLPAVAAAVLVVGAAVAVAVAVRPVGGHQTRVATNDLRCAGCAPAVSSPPTTGTTEPSTPTTSPEAPPTTPGSTVPSTTAAPPVTTTPAGNGATFGGTYTWTEVVTAGPGSTQTIEHRLVLTDQPSGGGIAGRLTETGFQTNNDVVVEGDPADQFFVVSVVSVQAGSAYKPGDVLFQLSGDVERPTTTLEGIAALRQGLPRTGTYFTR